MQHKGLFLTIVITISLWQLAASTTKEEPEWWDRIQKQFQGSSPPVQLCTLEDIQHSCPRRPKDCFVGTKRCPGQEKETHPKQRCTCNIGDSEYFQRSWSCVDVMPCPKVIQPVENNPNDNTDNAVYRSSPGQPFDVTMNLMTPNVLSGYKGNIEQLLQDFEQAVRFYVNALINLESRYYLNPPIEAVEQAPESPSAKDAYDFDTNNQVEGVDEADTVKSDGTYVYAVYGDAVLVWEAITGTPITNYTLPPLKSSSSPLYYYPFISIRGMSLASERLVLYVSGYGSEVRKANPSKRSAFLDRSATRIVVLDTSTLPASRVMTVVSQHDVDGSYGSARSIGSDIHVVTTRSIDYASSFYHLYRFKWSYTGMTSREYIEAATEIARPLIKDFASTLKNDIRSLNLTSIPKISLWQSELGENANIMDTIFSGGAITRFDQITSFSLAGLTGTPSFSTAGVFAPSSSGYTYVINKYLVFAGKGWNWSPSFQGSIPTTYLIGFNLDGASAAPAFLNSIPGYINNQYHINIHEGAMSVATAITWFWPVWDPGFSVWPRIHTVTENTVYVFSLPTATDPMTELGRVGNLGKPGERFTSVRFFGNICYAVTFRQIDPFYVISTDPQDIRLLGELEISGFSSYMHSINKDDTLLVAVGQEADKEGRVLGIQISLFDATTPSKPTLLDRFVVEQDLRVWSTSTVEFDYKAFRYLPLGPEFGVAIIPLEVRAWYRGDEENDGRNFDGFLAFDVSREFGISQRLSVSHAEADEFYECYYSATLPQRSLVFNGNMTTLKGHSVIMTDLDTGETRWKMVMAKPPNEDWCICWWFDL